MTTSSEIRRGRIEANGVTFEYLEAGHGPLVPEGDRALREGRDQRMDAVRSGVKVDRVILDTLQDSRGEVARGRARRLRR